MPELWAGGVKWWWERCRIWGGGLAEVREGGREWGGGGDALGRGGVRWWIRRRGGSHAVVKELVER